ncbi:hypothetical protein SISSUDRAFT_75283 [Sistotremastrum suecicum HHB10207 ss-3]|uniref:Uncharacterized protein n=1 Tax=Sistotremastrum suecicum HHB10207 ss-3 TaxID=1314776 RepID=A0A166BDP1_9AGAM|nr:hypothetical protein SISSUDRAFT_75283 [Sistotremastrum suecicum HHB10207 ss-3]
MTMTLIQSLILSSLFFGLFNSLGALSPPDALNITYSQNVTQGESIFFGYSFPSQSIALSWNITLSVLLPNGTTDILTSDTTAQITTDPDNPPLHLPDPSVISCLVAPVAGATVVPVNASLPGSYTLFWNVTYYLSSDPSKAANGSCGPPPSLPRIGSYPKMSLYSLLPTPASKRRRQPALPHLISQVSPRGACPHQPLEQRKLGTLHLFRVRSSC